MDHDQGSTGALVPAGVEPSAVETIESRDRRNRNELARRWWESYQDDSPHTAARYKRDIQMFFGWADATGYDVFRLIPMHIQEYRRWLGEPDRVERYTRKTKLSDSTIAARIAAVSSYYRYAQQQAGSAGFVPNPAKDVRRPKQSTESQTTGLTEDEVTAILRVAEVRGLRDYALVLLLVTVGLRISEACQLDVGDLVKDAGEWMLRVQRKGHGNTTILVACPEPTADLLREYTRGRSGAMFQDRHGERMTRRQAAYWIKTMVKAALADPNDPTDEGPTISPHSFRHTATTLALSQPGVTLVDVAAQMGHTTTQTTARYDRANRRRNNAAARALGRMFAPRPSVADVEAAPAEDNAAQAAL